MEVVELSGIQVNVVGPKRTPMYILESLASNSHALIE
jgi:hypothetical protein